MTIKPGEEWGAEIERPASVFAASTDAALGKALRGHPDEPLTVTGGDLWRTLGGPTGASTAPARRYPIDLLEVRLDGRDDVSTAVAHVVARRPWWTGGWLAGPVLLVMNVEFLGDWDVAPRGHPNDGRVETFELDASLGPRQRLAVHRRLPSATHLPHPAITTRPVRERTWDFPRPLHVWIDGVHHGSARALGVAVRPDAASIVV